MERAELARALRQLRPAAPSAGTAATGGPRVIREAEPEKFLPALAAALETDENVFLADPAWGERERAQAEAIISSAAPSGGASSGRGDLMIPTGGTSGRIRLARHNGRTLAAAVQGFTRHFGLGRVNSIGVLPLHHVSGLMAAVRCALTGGNFVTANWKELEAGNRPVLGGDPEGWTLSLVPTQLERLLRDPGATAWLRQFRIVFLGGAPARAELLERAAAARLPLSPGYGLTETAAMIAGLRPAEFLAGARGAGSALPHATISISAAGSIVVEGESLFRGYFPDGREPGPFVTGDAGRMDSRGYLHVLGRTDAVIISGGEKIDPGVLEAVLRESGELPDVVVLGQPDPEWGEAVIAAYPARLRPDWPRLQTTVEKQLAPAQRPKRYVPLAAWPENAQGKVNREEVRRLVAEALGK